MEFGRSESIVPARSAAMTGADPRDLYRELRSCQGRLGTSAEIPGDFDRVLALAHEINNHLTVAYVEAMVDAPPAQKRSLLSVCRQFLGSSREAERKPVS